MVGVHVAARNRARFSALWFAAGFAAPGMVRWIRGWPAEATLLPAFVAAPMVHYASVVAVLAFDPATFCTIPSPPAWRLRVGFCWCSGRV
jgi:hypothetical protein